MRESARVLILLLRTIFQFRFSFDCAMTPKLEQSDWDNKTITDMVMRKRFFFYLLIRNGKLTMAHYRHMQNSHLRCVANHCRARRKQWLLGCRSVIRRITSWTLAKLPCFDSTTRRKCLFLFCLRETSSLSQTAPFIIQIALRHHDDVTENHSPVFPLGRMSERIVCSGQKHVVVSMLVTCGRNRPSRLLHWIPSRFVQQRLLVFQKDRRQLVGKLFDFNVSFFGFLRRTKMCLFAIFAILRWRSQKIERVEVAVEWR